MKETQNRFRIGNAIPYIHTQGIEFFNDLPVLWKSSDAKPTFIVKDITNKFIISIYPPGGNRVARSMIDSYNSLLRLTKEESLNSGERYAKVVFQPSDAVTPRVLSYGAAIREALTLGKRLFMLKEIDPIITISSSIHIANEIRIFGKALLWINSHQPTKKIYDFIHTYNRIAQDSDRDYTTRIEDTKTLFAQQKDLFICYAGDIKKENITLPSKPGK